MMTSMAAARGRMPAASGAYRWAATILAALLLALIAGSTIKSAVEQPPSFDGAMNLQVASSLAMGEGYRRTYAEREPFPHEIQTGAPYLFPSAAVYRIFGVGVQQSQVINATYYLLLLLMTYFLVSRDGGRLVGLLAATSVAAISGMLDYGFGGYGEIPALFWFFCATFVYFSRERTPTPSAAALAGIFVALAVLTKTVMLIGAGALGTVAILQLALTSDGQRRIRVARIAVLVVSAAAMIAMWEVYRAAALGGMDEWAQWWSQELGNVLKQAGTRAGYQDFAGSNAGKLAAHVKLLGGYFDVPVWLLSLWLVSIGLTTLALVPLATRRWQMWGVLALLTAAAVYFAWWLLVTPTQKAWHRRVINGMICADVAALMLASYWIRDVWGGFSTRFFRSKAAAAALLLSVPVVLFAGGITRLVQETPAQSDRMMEALQQIDRLPDDAKLVAVGWNSAPRLGLLSQRHVHDFNDMPGTLLQASENVFLLQERQQSTYEQRRVRDLYSLPTAATAFEVLRLPTRAPAPLEVQAEPAISRSLPRKVEYAYLRGFNRDEGENGRWLSADNLVLLEPAAGDFLRLRIHTAPAERYIDERAPTLRIWINDCLVGKESPEPGAVSTLTFSVPVSCVSPNEPAAVRLLSDNLLDIPINKDERALSFLVKELGFHGAKDTDLLSNSDFEVREQDPVRRSLPSGEDYAYLRGFNRDEGANGRWTTSDSSLLLLANPGDELLMRIYVPSAERYVAGRAPTVAVSADGCMLSKWQPPLGVEARVSLQISPSCQTAPAEPVVVRIEVDNVLDKLQTGDDRSLGVLVKELGFAPPGG